MFDAYKNRKKKQEGSNEEESQELNSIGVDFNNNENEEVNNEGESHNVADTRSSSSAQKGFFVICCLGLVVLLGFMFFKSKVKSEAQENVRTAAEVSKKDELPKFELPPDEVASAPAPVEASAPALLLDDTPASAPEAPIFETQPIAEQPAAPTPHEIRLRSALMVSDNDGGAKGGIQNVSGSSNDDVGAQPAALGSNDMDGGNGNGGGGSRNALADSLNPTATPSATANRFANRNLLLAKGTVIQCSLKTRIETQVAGMVACTTLRDVYSDNKKVLLLERGSTVEGEYQSAAEMGATRIFVLWTRVRTPQGIVVNLDSPATDTLGGAGLGGYVKHHFWRRFGNALMFSLIQDSVATGFKRFERSKTAQTIVYGNSEDTTNDIVQEIIKSTANIPPTIYKNQGDNAAVYVARDIDFSKVYSLKPIATHEVNFYNGGILQ
ncbi:TPA: type IV secretion system protein VirB10 [Neisseria meningitidis]